MFRLPSPLDKISHPLLQKHRVQLYIKRDDLIHQEISGNKWRKLKYNLIEAQAQGKNQILTFGGAYSNHITATASACKHFNLEAIGIIRGDELNESSNETLRFATEYGMELVFTDRSKYRALREHPSEISKRYPLAFVIPEGGANDLGTIGVGEIGKEIDISYDVIVTAVGTGTTVVGLIKALSNQAEVIGMSVLKGDFIKEEVRGFLDDSKHNYSNYTINTDFHFGGYGKHSAQLIDFINEMKKAIGILFDPIYTGKAFYGVWKMIEEGIFDDKTLIFLHTGGLQGIAGFNQKNPQKIHI